MLMSQSHGRGLRVGEYGSSGVERESHGGGAGRGWSRRGRIDGTHGKGAGKRDVTEWGRGEHSHVE